jgi:MFS transporter, FSR family, fosmidomycin resistance protein
MRNPSGRLSQLFAQIGHSYTHILMLLYPTVVLGLEPEFKLSYGELLVLMTAGNVLFGAGALPAGWLGDRWSTLAMMIAFFIGMGLSAVLTGMASSALGLAVGLGAIGLFASIYHPVGMAWLVRNAENKGRALGVNGVFGSLGVASAGVIAGLLTDFISWRAAFIIPGTICLITGLALAFCVKAGRISDTRTDVKPQSLPQRDVVLRVFIVLSVTMLCNGLLFQSFSSALPKVFAERIPSLTGGTASGAGMLVSVVYLFAMGAQLAGGHLADRFPMRGIYLLTSLTQVPVYLVAAQLVSLPMFFAVSLAAVLNTLAAPVENSLLTRYTPPKWRGTAFGAKFVLALGVGALGVPLVAYVHELSGGFFWYFVLLAFLSLTIFAAALWLPGDKPAAISAAVPGQP